MRANDNGAAQQRRQRWLGTAALGLGLVALAVIAVVIVVGVRIGGRIFPSQRAEAWVGAWTAYGCGIAAACAFLSILLAVLARRRANVGVLALLVALLAAMMLPVFVRKPMSRLKTQCLANTKNIAIALAMYTTDYNTFPAAEHWTDVFDDYTRNPDVYRCPEASGRCAFAYNDALADRRVVALGNPEQVVAFFESDRGWNGHGGPEAMTDFARHLGGENVGFPDGHAKWYARQRPAGTTDLSSVRYDAKWPHAFGEHGPAWAPVWRRGTEGRGQAIR